MIEEQFVSFDTAKMLKEAGFDVPCRGGYHVNRFRYEAPTQALAARWLREVHNIHVYAIQTNLPLTEPQTDEWEWGYVITKIDDPNGESICDMNYTSYEEAIETSLREAIKLIKK